MKPYNVAGYLIIFFYMLACMYSAPTHLGPWTGMLIGGLYFIFCWFFGVLYLADVLHLGIAHRSLDSAFGQRSQAATAVRRAGQIGEPLASRSWRETV